MKVLFVSSGKNGCVSDVVKNQGQSLIRAGIIVEYFLIKPGFLGYISAIPKIRKTFKKGNYDLIHAHYSLSAFSASLAGSFPLVVSLMGSDVYYSGFLRLITRFFYRNRWAITIVKSQKMKELLRMNKALVIPNGVDIERFKPISKTEARRRIGYFKDKKLIIFISNPNRPEKYFDLTLKTIKVMNNADVELIPVFNVPNEEIPFYLNSADVLFLTSKWEGSVNVIKEAMACNTPIVSTDVGDVRDNTIGVEGCYVCLSNPVTLAEGLTKALLTESRTNGRRRIISLKLDSESIARRIIAVYEQVAETS